MNLVIHTPLQTSSPTFGGVPYHTTWARKLNFKYDIINKSTVSICSSHSFQVRNAPFACGSGIKSSILFSNKNKLCLPPLHLCEFPIVHPLCNRSVSFLTFKSSSFSVALETQKLTRSIGRCNYLKIYIYICTSSSTQRSHHVLLPLSIFFFSILIPIPCPSKT